MIPTDQQITDALEHLDSGDIDWQMWLFEHSDIIRYCLKAALDKSLRALESASQSGALVAGISGAWLAGTDSLGARLTASAGIVLGLLAALGFKTPIIEAHDVLPTARATVRVLPLAITNHLPWAILGSH